MGNFMQQMMMMRQQEGHQGNMSMQQIQAMYERMQGPGAQ
jgi:hypothetical protein